MFCPRCGTRVPGVANFCPACGRRIPVRPESGRSAHPGPEDSVRRQASAQPGSGSSVRRQATAQPGSGSSVRRQASVTPALFTAPAFLIELLYDRQSDDRNRYAIKSLPDSSTLPLIEPRQGVKTQCPYAEPSLLGHIQEEEIGSMKGLLRAVTFGEAKDLQKQRYALRDAAGNVVFYADRPGGSTRNQLAICDAQGAAVGSCKVIGHGRHVNLTIHLLDTQGNVLGILSQTKDSPYSYVITSEKTGTLATINDLNEGKARISERVLDRYVLRLATSAMADNNMRFLLLGALLLLNLFVNLE